MYHLQIAEKLKYLRINVTDKQNLKFMQKFKKTEIIMTILKKNNDGGPKSA